MAWLETDRHGRLRIGFKYYDGRIYREPLGVEANKRTRADGERLSARFNSNCRPAFSIMHRFPNSERVKTLGLKRAEQRSDQTLREFVEAAWLPAKRMEGQAINVRLLQRDLQTSYRKRRDRKEVRL